MKSANRSGEGPVRRSIRRPLKPLALDIGAHPGLVHQVASAVGQEGDHSSRLLERPAPDRMIVEYTTVVLGRPVVTLEEVTVAPGSIHYRLLKGPLPAVEEDFEIDERPGGCTLRYRGWFEPNTGLRGVVDRFMVPRLYERALRASMAQVKAIAEERQTKSRQFRLEPNA